MPRWNNMLTTAHSGLQASLGTVHFGGQWTGLTREGFRVTSDISLQQQEICFTRPQQANPLKQTHQSSSEIILLWPNHCCPHQQCWKIETVLKTKSNNTYINPSSMVLALPLKGFMGRGSGRVTADPTHRGTWPLFVSVKACCCIVGHTAGLYSIYLIICGLFSSKFQKLSHANFTMHFFLHNYINVLCIFLFHNPIPVTSRKIKCSWFLLNASQPQPPINIISVFWTNPAHCPQCLQPHDHNFSKKIFKCSPRSLFFILFVFEIYWFSRNTQFMQHIFVTFKQLFLL